MNGVALMIPSVRRSLIDWMPVNGRLMRVRLQGKYANLSIIVSYSPTNEADENSKEEFYTQLQWLVDKTPRQDILLIMGDLNAQVGSHNEDLEGIMGKHGCGARNENANCWWTFAILTRW